MLSLRSTRIMVVVVVSFSLLHRFPLTIYTQIIDCPMLGHLGCFQFCANPHDATVKWLPTYLLVCIWKSFWCVWAEGITPTHSLLGCREHCVIFHWQCPVQNTNLHSHWEHMRIPIVPCTHQHLKSLVFYTFISLMIFKWHFSNKLILFLFLLMCQTTLYSLQPFFRTFLVKYPFLINIYWVPVCMCAC